MAPELNAKRDSGNDAGNVVFQPGRSYVAVCFILLRCTGILYAHRVCVIFHIIMPKGRKKKKRSAKVN